MIKSLDLSLLTTNFDTIILTFLLVLGTTPISIAQVETRIIEDKKDFIEYVKNHNSEYVNTFIIPRPKEELQKMLDEDKNTDLSRYAIGLDMEIAQTEGSFYEGGKFINWKMEIEAQKATSINLLFKKIVLPAGARMYLYSLDKKMVSGPITSKNIFKGKYMSDMMYGDKVTVEVIFPKETNILDFSLSIFKVMYGIKPNRYSSDLRGYGDSQFCNIDINCLTGDTYQFQKRAIAMVFPSNGLPCSGSLVADICNSRRPYLLTAFHCFDLNMDKTLSDDEIEDVENSSYRFHYEHESCIDPIEPQSWLTISGAQLLASWQPTDFALVELSSMPENITPNIINTGSINDFSYGTIHHPQGDVKKITVGSDPIVDFGNIWVVESWDVGIAEPGSSGAPLFDNSRRIIGILNSGSVYQDCPTGDPNQPISETTAFTKIDKSWTGGGTTETSLSAWLGGIPPDFDTTNLVDSLSNISGPDVLCHGEDAYFCVNSSLPSTGMSWSVTPTNIFASDTIGNGSCANLILKDEFKYKGYVTITFTGNFRVYYNCSTSGTLTKKIWIGKPTIPQLNLPECFNSGTNISISANVEGATSYQWVFPNCPSPLPANDPNPDCWFNYDGNTDDQINIYVGQQGGSISLFASNKCGSTSINVPIYFCDPQVPGPGPHIRFQNVLQSKENSLENFTLYPNPSSDMFTLKGESQLPTIVEIISTSGEIMDRFEYQGSKMVFKSDNMSSGMYLIRMRSTLESRIMKLLIIK